MPIRVDRYVEYDITCDLCGRYEIYHTGDSENGITVNSVSTALKACGYKKSKGRIICPQCQFIEAGGIVKHCKNCKYVRHYSFYSVCFGQKNAPKVELDDCCDSWKPGF